MEKPVEEPPPYTILVHGPPGVGKSTLIRCLVKHYTKQDVKDIKGPLTLVSGKQRRLTFIECPQDMSAMIDAAKYADLVLLVIDGDFGFEMETFEFLNMLQVHGFPKVMGVLTHLDTFKDTKALKKTKKTLKHRFWTEIYQGAKLFYLSGIKNGRYLNREILNLARFISVMKFRPLSWRQNHPFMVVDRFEDTTSPEAIRKNEKCDRDVAVYGYLRGTNWKKGTTAHIAGAGDFRPTDVEAMPDPCPLPSQIKKRGLNEKERVMYAPMSDVGGLLYDKDAMYIDIPDWKVQYSAAMVEQPPEGREGEALVRSLQSTRMTVDEKLQNSKIQMFSGGSAMIAHDEFEKRMRGEEGSSDALSDSSLDSEDDQDDDNGDIGSPGDPKEQVVHHNGRLRRRAVFQEMDGESGRDKRLMDNSEGDGSSSEEDDEDLDEGLGHASKWKSSMVERAAAIFSSRSVDLQRYIYGDPNESLRSVDQNNELADSDSDDDIFKLKKYQTDEEKLAKMGQSTAVTSAMVDIDAVDVTKLPHPFYESDTAVAKWSEDSATESLRNRFVTGDWEQGAARGSARPDESDDEVYGDFEDIEAGAVFHASEDPATQAAAKAIKEAEKEELAMKKAAKKAAFDSAYDQGGAAGADKAIEGKTKVDGNDEEEEDEEETYYDAMKRELAERAQKTKEVMDSLDPAQRFAMEVCFLSINSMLLSSRILSDAMVIFSLQGYRPGTYIRVKFSGIPYEMVKNFDPRLPMLIGGIGKSEEAQGYMQVRLKRHRWFPKILKNRDPLIFSVGWRRFQSVPVFAIKDNNERHRMLKYSPEHMHCLAAVWGPLAPPGTGVLAVQKLDRGLSHWRISATGVILQLDATIDIVKKLKLVGTPFKIHKHTAFVNGMFNSQLEAAKFEGASIRTVSGIRGTIKKSIRVGSINGARDGSFRATFEDKPLLSDIIFLRAWVRVDIPKFFNPVTDLLGPRAKVPERIAKQRRGRSNEAEDQDDAREAVEGVSSLAIDTTLKAAEFDPAHKFLGRRKGFIFTSGPKGLGYYADVQPSSMGTSHDDTSRKKDVNPEPIATTETREQGWVPMRAVADIRRERGTGAPRLSDSLYKPIERKPRVFNPLRVPTSLQAALPFKSKPKIEKPRRKKSLDQRRAIILEPEEKKKVSLVSQLNAIRNVKAQARREQRKRHQEKMAKRANEEESWRRQYNREERKKRYVEQGQSEKRQRKKLNTS